MTEKETVLVLGGLLCRIRRLLALPGWRQRAL